MSSDRQSRRPPSVPVSPIRLLQLLALVLALGLALAVIAAAWPQSGCIRVARSAPLLENSWPPDLPTDPPMPSNRVLRTLAPGEYHYRDIIDSKSWRAYEVKIDSVRGYLIHEGGVTESCR